MCSAAVQRLEPATKRRLRIVSKPRPYKITGRSRNVPTYNMREIHPAPEKTATWCRSASRRWIVSKVFWRPATLRKSRRKGRTAVTSQPARRPTDTENPTAYYLTITFTGRNEAGAFSPAKAVDFAPFSTVLADTGNYGSSHGFFISVIWMITGALHLTTLGCGGHCITNLSEK